MRKSIGWIVFFASTWAGATPCVRPDSMVALDGRLAVVSDGLWVRDQAPWRLLLPVKATKDVRLVFGDDGVLLIWDGAALWSSDLKTVEKRLEGRSLAPALARVGGRTAMVLDQSLAVAEKDFEFKHFECASASWRNAVDLTAGPSVAAGNANDCGNPEGLVFFARTGQGLKKTAGPEKLVDVLGNSAGWFYTTSWVVTPEGGHDALHALKPGRQVLVVKGKIGPLAVAPDQKSAAVVADGVIWRLRGASPPKRLVEAPGVVTALAFSGTEVAAITEAGLQHWITGSGWQAALPACPP